MKNWENAQDVFDYLNNNFVYVVIRNFELFYESILTDNHADIDILCRKADKKKLITLIEAIPRLQSDDGIHYEIQIASERIPIDVRCVGDGYYDKNWTNSMLACRVLDNRGFYRMDDDNYFWSLLYHALYHKGNISEEYFYRLSQLKPDLFPITSEKLEVRLYEYMQKKGYYYTIGCDKYLWYYYTKRCSDRLRVNPIYRIRMFKRKCKEFVQNKLTRINNEHR